MEAVLCTKENDILEFWNLRVQRTLMNPLLQSESPLCETKSELGFPMRNTEDGKPCAFPLGPPKAYGLEIEYVQ